MPKEKMQFPKLPELDDDKLTPFQRFRLLAKRVVAVPRDAVREPKKDKSQTSG